MKRVGDDNYNNLGGRDTKRLLAAKRQHYINNNNDNRTLTTQHMTISLEQKMEMDDTPENYHSEHKIKIVSTYNDKGKLEEETN